MRIEIIEVGLADAIADLRRDYLASLVAPFDGMWESFASIGRHLELRSGSERAGYATLDENGRLLQFHVTAPLVPSTGELFAAVVARDDVGGAMVSTADPWFLGACLDRHETLRVHTLLYDDRDRPGCELEAGPEERFDVAAANELDAILAFQRDSLDHDPGTWLDGYLENLIRRGELHTLRVDGEILASGEARVSDSQPPFADLGVITARRHRGRGVASRVLGLLRRNCRERRLVPICSTTVENVAARRAISRAGFVSRHRILEIGF